MSGTRSPSRKAPATEDGRWPVWELALLLYPFAMAAVAINLFMASLIGIMLGWQALDPFTSILWAVPLGVPAALLAGRWVRSLIDEAEPPVKE
ncbi:hypothetical protein Q5Y75_18035 [Ruegeria sp. 2205SS24-7]|uniref:hypothetical protein n=1 Tax=Ruegeria discodermiae TaxID=3064389 RepID=UPI002741F42A|nr:hypothetical protein [Ruegeria sp. 2205SS24-7]MDP5219123.1 hypothetical protein [Ruegeria sp. 2205SS24-7]